MFYYKNWELFCRFLSDSGIRICTAQQSLQIPGGERFVVLKHDVEAAVPTAYRLAAIEHQYGICGSYYVQAYLMEDRENIRLLKEMQRWGHEISYHYDVLDAHSGDYKAALASFEKYMKLFADNGFTFKTICQHGNPVKKRVGYTSNRDFFRNKEIHARYAHLVDMVVDYSQHTEHPYLYISDAGYRWNVITEPETNDLHPEVKDVRIGGFKALMAMIGRSNESFIVSTHPHRWRQYRWQIQSRILLFRVVRTSVMGLRRIPGVEAVLNRFYFLAKKI